MTLDYIQLQNNYLFALDKDTYVALYANQGYQPVQLTPRDVKRLRDWLDNWLKENEKS